MLIGAGSMFYYESLNILNINISAILVDSRHFHIPAAIIDGTDHPSGAPWYIPCFSGAPVVQS